MTTLDHRPATAVRTEIGEISPGPIVYMIPVNAWIPWADRATGAAAGTWLAAGVTVLETPAHGMWATATGIAMTLLFAFALAGRELRQKHPTRFERAS
uniref:hypothetical protein n=1 Tax=Paractinoplanes polyasparticus TaxID=2856853 RepID=UPI001C85F3B2|nr:hypothetical protein [Actinoplanes polyasparticus]